MTSTFFSTSLYDLHSFLCDKKQFFSQIICFPLLFSGSHSMLFFFYSTKFLIKRVYKQIYFSFSWNILFNFGKFGISDWLRQPIAQKTNFDSVYAYIIYLSSRLYVRNSKLNSACEAGEVKVKIRNSSSR